MKDRRHATSSAAGLLIAAFGAMSAPIGGAWAQSGAGAPAKAPASTPPAKPAPGEQPARADAKKGGDPGQSDEAKPPPDETMPGLDELLGIPKNERPRPRPEDDPGLPDPSIVDPNKKELDRALTATEAAEMFRQAIKQMGDVADLLQLAGETGIGTQRIQEEIIRKLDVLIEQAEQQGGGGSSSSKSRPEQQQQQQQVGQQPRPQENPQSQQQANSEPGEAPAGSQSGALPDVLDAAKAAWGSLPERFREALYEVSPDQFSSLYRRMTEEYYRRLAEEPK